MHRFFQSPKLTLTARVLAVSGLLCLAPVLAKPKWKGLEISRDLMAEVIAADSGRSVEVYSAYAARLSETLNGYSDEQQMRIFQNLIDDGNNGHGNDLDGIDESNPNAAKKEQKEQTDGPLEEPQSKGKGKGKK